jgi:beta-phosphoglucomutase-like phosphatase (HAD superfamily)
LPTNQVPAEGSVVFEDAPIGILAAQAAGLRVVAMTTSVSAAQFNALAELPDLACRDVEAVLALADW